MRSIVIALTKGGVGKTTVSVNLGHGLARAGNRILLIDCDVEGQLGRALGVADPGRGLAGVVAGDPLADRLVEARPNLWLLPAGGSLAAAQRDISRRDVAPERVLADAFGDLSGFDFALLDTPPSWGPMVINALFVASEVLIPVSMEPLALRSLATFASRLAQLRRHHEGLRLRFVVPTFVDGRVKRSAEVLAQVTARYPDVVTSPIRYSTRLSECAAFGRTIYEHDPRGRGAEDFDRLVEEVTNAGP